MLSSTGGNFKEDRGGSLSNKNKKPIPCEGREKDIILRKKAARQFRTEEEYKGYNPLRNYDER